MGVIGWEVLLALITISSLVGIIFKLFNAITKPTQELNLSIKELSMTLRELQGDLLEYKRVNEKTHDNIFEILKGHDAEIRSNCKSIDEIKYKIGC